MPIIESKKTGETHFVTIEAWEEFFKPRGKHKLIDDSDIKDTIIPAPESIVNFPEAQDVSSEVEQTVQEIPEMSRDELKQYLDEAEIEYNPRTPTKTLLKLYEEIKNGSNE